LSRPTGFAMNLKVPLTIPFTVIGVFTAAQLMLGSSPAIVAMCAVAVTLPFLYMGLYGRDLYGVLFIGFSFKYVGVALAAKTFYGQTLESNLYDPYAAFGLNLLFMFVLTAMFIVARALDRGQAIFAFPLDLVSLRRLSVICICIGIAGTLSFSTHLSNTDSNSGGGAAQVLGASFRNYYYLGLIAEAVYAVTKSSGRSFVTGRLVFLFLIENVIAIFINEREFVATSLIGIITVAFLYKMLHFRHVIIGLVAGGFFISVFTPITIYLRLNKEGLSLTEFAELAEDTIIKAATDPEFFKYISDTVKNSAYQDTKALVAYNYYGAYGDTSGVLDRVSFVALLDAVYNGTRTREPIGMAAINQSLARVAPGFLGYDKSITNVGAGDWLSWQTGLSEPGRSYFANFGLPMEGLATWGLTGMIVYPFIFMLPVLYICGRLSSLRLPLPVSIFLFTEIQHLMLEGTSDTFLATMTRLLPVNILCLFLLHRLLRSRAILPRARAV
jgi:hypothetical protein